jgi:HSP20 family protein
VKATPSAPVFRGGRFFSTGGLDAEKFVSISFQIHPKEVSPMVIDFNTLYNFPSRFDRVLEDFFKSPMGEDRRMAFPPLNLSKDDENIYVRAELPGVELADVELTLSDKTLVLKGERTSPKGNYYRQERPSGVFHRVVNIAVPVDRDKVKAVMTDGVLTVTLPKSEDVKPRSINIEIA